MNIETLSIKVTTDGISKAKNDIARLGDAAESTEKKVHKLVQSVDEMVKKFVTSSSGVKALTSALSVVNKSTQTSDAAMKALGVSVTALSNQVGVLASRMSSGTEAIRTSTVHIRHHTREMNDAHAAARGLTGSLGALWLTYGNIAPLAAGAAIGASMKAIISIGMEVEATLENIRIKGENSAEEMRLMGQAVADLGKGVYGPQEVTKALEALTLAGLRAKDAVNAIGAAQNLALVGGTDINNAAEALVTIGTAVGATSKEYDYLADGISKAANISLASVDSIAQAVKRASVVNKLYGATFEDILTQTAALAQLGIKNTAAGTAITNFYANALGGTDKANKALKELGFSFQDATGKAKPLVEAYQEFTDKLNQFDLKSQQKIITDIFGERALRDVEGLRDLVNQAAQSTERLADGTLKYANRLQEVQAQIKDSAGTSALQAAQQSLTTENQVKSMINTLKSSFGEVFKEIEPQFRSLLDTMREAFGSDDFKTAISNVAKAFMWVADAIVSNIAPLTAVVEGLLAYAAITSGGALFAKLIPVISGVAIQMGLVAKGTTAAALATTAFGRAISLIPGIGMVLGAATAAWALYTLHTDNATKSTREFAQEKAKLAESYNTDFLKALEDEAARLDKVNAKLAVGLSLQQAEIATTKELALEKERNYNKDAVDAAQKSLDEAKKAFAPVMFSYTAKQSKEYQNMVAAQNALNDAKNKQTKFDSRAAELAQAIIDKTKQQQKQMEENAAAAQKIAEDRAGTRTFTGSNNEADKAAKKALSFLEQERLELEQVIARYNARARAAVASYMMGERVAADSQQAMVMVNKEEGKYLSEAIYLKQMKLAKDADEAKANFDRINQYVEIGQKISNIIEGEKIRAELAAKGDDSSKLTAQIAAMGKYNNISKNQLDIDIARAQVADKILETNDRRNRLESATKSSEQRAERYADELASLDKYGIAVRQTAVEFAKAEVAKQGFYDDSLEGKTRLAAAGVEDVNKSLLDLGKTYQNLLRDMGDQAGLNLSAVIGVEQAKVEAYRNTAEKAIEYQQATAQAGVVAQMEAGKLTAMQAAGELAMISAQVDKIRAVMGEKFAIDFKVAGLRDVANIFDDMADAADRMGEKFAGPVKGLDAFSRAFKNLAKIEEQEKKAGQKYSAERVGAYADMLDGAKSFFKEGTGGYKALEKASQVASAIQIAMNIKTMASNAASAVSGVIAGAAQMFAQSGWGGFAGVAAMLGVMAALGFSGGTSGTATPTAEERQKTQGTGSVLGDGDAKSESIANSLEYLKDNSDVMLPLTSQMAKSLQNIEASMAGLGSLILRAGGVADGSNFGINEGTFANVGGIFGKALDGIIGGDFLTKALFGKTTRKITDSGISFGGSVDALQAGQGYSQYVDVETTKKRLLGLSKKTSYSTETQALNAELANQFGLIFTSLEDSLKLAAGGFGKSGTEVGNAISNMVIEQTTLSLKDLKGDELTEAINSVISKTMDDIAKAAFPDLGGFQQIGEGYAQTVLRVSSGIEQANVALEAFNITAIKYTDVVNKQGDVAAEIFQQSVMAVEQFQGVRDIVQNLAGDVSELADTYAKLKDAQDSLFSMGFNGGNLSVDTIKGAGGLDNLSDSLQDYFENILTEEQQAAIKTANLQKEFAKLNLTVPASKDAFTALIKSVDDGTAGGNKLVGQLIALSSVFAEVQEKADEAAQAIQDKLLQSLDAAFSALQKSVNAQKKALTDTYNDRVKALNEEYEIQKKSAQDQLDIAKESVAAITKVFDSLTNALKATQVESDAINKVRRIAAQEYLKSVQGTDLTKAVGMNSALEALGKPSEEFYATFEEYAKDQAKTANLITNLQNQAGTQKSFAELTVRRLESIIEAIELNHKTEIEQLQKNHEEEIARLDGIIEKAQAQVDAANSIVTALLPISEALSQLAGAIALLKATQAGSSGGSTGGIQASIESLYNNLLGRQSDEAGMQSWLKSYSYGVSLEDITKGFLNSDEYKSLHPSFDVGINEVPYDMTANIHKGERIMPAADNAELMRRLDDSSSSNAEIASLREEIHDLKEVIRSGDVAIVGQLREQTKVLRKWDGEGIPETRETE